ncbi:hypothetical protein DC498_01145 [Terrimonas sp.]|nr:MAG: hypothetical protein BGP13_05985 [Sphingobacteriales bacterium 40-81]PVD54027.1 hypothetical protein DC498_01145 [Terrimonas sp.]
MPAGFNTLNTIWGADTRSIAKDKDRIGAGDISIFQRFVNTTGSVRCSDSVSSVKFINLS